MWIDLHNPEQDGSWILVSFDIGEDSFVQGGKDISTSGLSTYLLARSTSIRIFFLSAFACLGLSFFVVYLLEQPLKRLKDTIQTALLQKSFTRPEKRDILTPLYTLWETIFYQNRKLISKIQSSLDNVAHDLRTPMTRLRAVAEYALQSDQKDPQPYRNALSDCLEESERVLSMLGVMMSVAEAEAGTMRLELKAINITETLEDVIGLYQYVAEEAQITVSLAASQELIVQADKTRLSQVWANLLDNAIKYGHESGKVTIDARQQGNMAIIRFIDDGMGISESELDKIWERLYRGDRSRNKQGLGLGLNYVKAVVEAHGGTITVTSSVRQGACFTITLCLQNEITNEGSMIRKPHVGD
jgi:signal transduction histidine kinase